MKIEEIPIREIRWSGRSRFLRHSLMGKKYGGAAGSAGTAADAVVLFPDGI